MSNSKFCCHLMLPNTHNTHNNARPRIQNIIEEKLNVAFKMKNIVKVTLTLGLLSF